MACSKPNTSSICYQLEHSVTRLSREIQDIRKELARIEAIMDAIQDNLTAIGYDRVNARLISLEEWRSAIESTVNTVDSTAAKLTPLGDHYTVSTDPGGKIQRFQ